MAATETPLFQSTGKSFIGALLAKALHDLAHQRILVVCYTNHALDQFLEDLMDIGIPEANMLRLGGKSTPRTESLSLFNARNAPRATRSQGDWSVIDGLKLELQELSARLRHASNSFITSSNDYHAVLSYLEFDDPDHFDAFTVPRSEDGMATVGQGGKTVTATYLIERWAQGKDAGIYKTSANVRASKQVWKLPKAERDNKLTQWRDELVKEHVETIHSWPSNMTIVLPSSTANLTVQIGQSSAPSRLSDAQPLPRLSIVTRFTKRSPTSFSSKKREKSLRLTF